MSGWPHLNKAPIVEGLLDIQVARSEAATLDSLKNACDHLAADFPSREELRTFTSQFSFSPEGDTNWSTQPAEPIGIILRSADQKWAAQFRLDGFTLSRLEPYTSWEDLTQRAKNLWAKYRSASAPGRIVRVASRFINRIHLPPGESFDKTFTTTFAIAPPLPQAVAGFLLRIVIPFEPEQSVAIVTQALPEHSQDCTLDLDAFAMMPDGVDESDAWAKLEQLRSVKNRLFFQSLTPEALERFK